MALHAPAPARGGIKRSVLRLGADSSRIEQHIRAHQSHRAGRLRKPLIPADADAKAALPRIPYAKAGIPRAEVELFLIARTIGNVALAIDTQGCAICIDHHNGVEIERAFLLIDRDRNDDAQLGCKLRELMNSRMRLPFNRAGEMLFFLRLAEIMAAEKLRRQNDISSLGRSFADEAGNPVDILLNIIGGRELDGGERDLPGQGQCLLIRQGFRGSCSGNFHRPPE